MYARFFKRIIDFVLALCALLLLSPLLLVLTVVGAIIMRGNPFFLQPRPGKGERIFHIVKFRTMTNRRDKQGRLLPDEKRLTKYGAFLRGTSLDELPELLNILKGDMAIVGPRPLLVRDMVFMTGEERRRHTVRAGLTGLAQCNGRNHMSWEKRFAYDLAYIGRITFWGDLKIVLKTAVSVLRHEGIAEEGKATAEDLGDYLLESGKINKETYDLRQKEANAIIEKGNYKNE